LALAQDAPRVEVFGGYQLVRASSGVQVSGIDNFMLNGWNASLSGFFNRYIGVTGEFAGTYGTPKIEVPQVGSIGINTHLYTFMFGPVVRAANKGPVQPFAHVLFGGARVAGSVGIPGIGGLSISESDTGFAWAAGGGVDFKVLPLISIRPAQVDFLQTHIGGTNQSNFRYSAGVVVRF
jgi:opacity protein-like surface antigen